MQGFGLRLVAALVICGNTGTLCLAQRAPEAKTAHTLASGFQLLRAGECDLAARTFRDEIARKPEDVNARLLLGIAADCSEHRESVLASFKKIWNYDLDPQQSPDLVLVQSALHSGWSPAPKSAESKYLSAVLYYRAGEFDAARKLLDSVGAPINDSWAYYNLLGSIYLRKADFANAKAILATALTRNNQQADTFYKLGTVALATGETSDAIRYLRQGLHLRAYFPSASGALGIALLQSGDISGARDSLLRSTAIGPEIYVYLGEAYERLDDTDAAIEAYKKATLGDSQLFEALFPLGRLLLKRGQSEQSITYLRRAAEIHPDRAETQIYLGLALAAGGKPELAKAAAQRAKETGQNHNAEFHDALGTLLKVLGQTEDAEKSFAHAVQLDQTHEDYFSHLAATQVSTSEERAIVTLNQGLTLFPKSAQLHYLFSLLLLNRGSATEAADEARKATELAPGIPEFIQSLGVCLATLEKDSEAAHAFREVLALNNHYAPAMLQLGILEAKAGAMDAAEQRFKAAREADPAYAPAYFRLGKIYYDRGDDTQALPLLEKARELDPDWEDTYFLLGMLYRRKGDQEKASTLLEAFRQKKSELQNTRRRTYDKANSAPAGAGRETQK
jgi:tetratricopeptide (TPR) repeat protein